MQCASPTREKQYIHGLPVICKYKSSHGLQQHMCNHALLCAKHILPTLHTQVSPHYDSLLAKLMVWAPTRQEAVQKMATALSATKLQGPPNNLQLLRVSV